MAFYLGRLCQGFEYPRIDDLQVYEPVLINGLKCFRNQQVRLPMFLMLEIAPSILE